MCRIISFGNVRMSGMGKKLVPSYAALGVGLAIVLTLGLTAISSIMEQPSQNQFIQSQPESEKIAPIEQAPKAGVAPPAVEMQEKPLMMPAMKLETAQVTQVAGSADANNPEFFVPPELTITVGTTVTWVNDDSATHTITSGDVNDPENWGKVFESGMNKPRTTFEHTFNTPGEYPYLCQLHPWMIGKIIVQEAMAQAPLGTMPSETQPVSPEAAKVGVRLNTFQEAVLDQIAADQVVGSPQFTEQFLGATSAFGQIAAPREALVTPTPQPPGAGEQDSYLIATEMPASPFSGFLVVLPYILAAAVGSVVFVLTRKRV